MKKDKKLFIFIVLFLAFIILFGLFVDIIILDGLNNIVINHNSDCSNKFDFVKCFKSNIVLTTRITFKHESVWHYHNNTEMDKLEGEIING